jgi:hypothetical protein
MTQIPDLQATWFLSGLIVMGLVQCMKWLKWFPSDASAGARAIKQLTALVVSVLVVVAWPLMSGQELVGIGPVILAIVQTYMTSITSYSLLKTAADKLAEKPQ